jgi:hypothetical protein
LSNWGHGWSHGIQGKFEYWRRLCKLTNVWKSSWRPRSLLISPHHRRARSSFILYQLSNRPSESHWCCYSPY